jgi:catechol 2,3-dioxygenase-like lactoylglutathione lyase family enzyme
MFDHVKFGVTDYAASKAFFLKALEPLGITAGSEGAPSYGIELVSKGDVSLCLFQTDEQPAHLHMPAVPRQLLRGLRHRAGWAQHRSGVPQGGGLKGRG